MIVLLVIFSVGYLGKGKAKRNDGISVIVRSLLRAYTGILMSSVSQQVSCLVYGNWQRNDIGKTDFRADLIKLGKTLTDLREDQPLEPSEERMKIKSGRHDLKSIIGSPGQAIIEP